MRIGCIYVRDMTYREDASRIRTGSGPRAMATLRSLATFDAMSYRGLVTQGGLMAHLHFAGTGSQQHVASATSH